GLIAFFEKLHICPDSAIDSVKGNQTGEDLSNFRPSGQHLAVEKQVNACADVKERHKNTESLHQ
ncbi:MAG: hypothetical protein ACK4NS_12665, partial [Saprospiraceae bacterium]